MTTSATILHTRLVELDFSGIELVLTGWFARDKLVYRIAKLGMHALVTSHLVGQPVSLELTDDDLLAALQEVKNAYETEYNTSKRVVHGTSYGMTPHGMALMFPKHFRTPNAARKVQEVYFSCAPGVRNWQNAVQQRAYEQDYLGGPTRPGYHILDDPNAHPFGYRHDFYGVLRYRPIEAHRAAALQRQHFPIVEMNSRFYVVEAGEDSKSCLAFYPQSTASGILKEVMLELFAEPDHPNYIGEAYYGRTPLRAPIHDSLFLEVPPRKYDRVIEAVYRAMLHPVEEMPLPPAWQLGSHLTVGVEGKAGLRWSQMEKIKGVPQAVYSDAPASDKIYFPATEGEEEDVADLNVPLRAKVVA